MFRRVAFIVLLARGCAHAAPDVTVSPLSAQPGNKFTMVVTLLNCPAGGKLSDIKPAAAVSGSDLTLTQKALSDCTLSLDATVADKPVNRSVKVVITDNQKPPNTLKTIDFAIIDIAAQEVTVTPLTAQPGNKFAMMVTLGNCPAGGKLSDRNPAAAASGSDLTLTQKTLSDCTLSLDATVADKPVNRNVKIVVTDDKKPANTLKIADFAIVDLPAGPIPPGLDPQVDATWDVMSENNCSDQFGVRLARRYYCIDVQMGNNTGYSILLAGVGFRRTAMGLDYKESTGSYLTARSVVQREQVLSGRNLTLRALQAAGLLIGGFTSFSGNAGRQGRIGLWSTLFGTTLATAYDQLIPDRTVRQASNLDDAALRDGRLIANNSPARFTVFVDRDQIKPLLQEDSAQLRADAQIMQQRAEVLDARFALAQTPTDLEVLSRAKNLAHAEATAVREAATRMSDRESSGRAPKVKRNHLNMLGRAQAPLEGNLIEVRRALGTLIIVGDQIEYKQRIQVDAAAVNPEVAVAAAPTVTGAIALDASPAKVSQKIKFTIDGANFDPSLASVAFTGPDPLCAVQCLAMITSRNASRIKGEITISTKGDYTVSVQNGSGGKSAGAGTVKVEAVTPP